MGKKLPPDEIELYRRIDEILYYIWDPIGVSRIPVPENRDEYYSYLPDVFNLLKSTKRGKELFDYLISIERDKMQIPVTDESKQRIKRVVDILLDYRKFIKEKNK